MLNFDAHYVEIEWALCGELLFPMYPKLTISSVESTACPLGNNTYPHTPLGGCVSPPRL